MTLQFKHFDTRLQQWIASEFQSRVDAPILTERLDNTLLELYFTDMPFSFGHIDEKSKLEDLYQHPEGHVLLLSSKNRLLYGPSECLKTIGKLCPDRKDRGAYGSIFLGSCKNAVQKEMNILVVDDVTGKNGGILPDEIAWRQVGDCHGKISPTLAIALSGSEEHVIQHRLGIPDQFRFAKGTLAPKNLSQLPYQKPDTQVDLIIPTSSFKGGDKKNNPITPGLHTVKVWIGEKERSQRGKNAISQIHASFPSGIKDYLKILEELTETLQELQNDPRKLAQYYCEKFELRQTIHTQKDLEHLTSDEEEDRETLDEIFDDLMYRIIKADVESGHYQLLETQKVTDELQRFLRKEWLELAIGKAATFERGMIIPSKDLKHGEICVPWLEDWEEVLNFRSPFLNSNGMCLSINRLVPDAFAPNGKTLEGVIVVNDEDHKRIQARIDALKAQGIESNEIDPSETESERQGRDFDGDCIGVARAKDFPYLTAEAKRRNEPENAYAPVKKEDKVSFYLLDGTQPDFEEIALFMSDSISVGIINNHATALEALESEIDILSKYGTLAQKSDYVRQIGTHYQNLIVLESANKPKPIPAQYRNRIAQIASIKVGTLTPESINAALSLNRSIYHDMIGEAGYQNQLAVDIFKSNRAPNMEAIADNNRLLHRIPNYIRDKKKSQMYLRRGIEVQGFSPVELMVKQANTHFFESPLVARPTEQFRDLFPENYTAAQYNQATLAKASFDKLFGAAVAAKIKLRHETGPVLKVLTKSGKPIEITNLIKFDHPLAFSAKQLNLTLVENQAKNAYHKLLALAQVPGLVDSIGNPVYKRLGTVCEISREQLGLRSGIKTGSASCTLASALTKSQVQLLFKQANDYATTWKKSIAESDLQSMAAAAWHVSTTSNNSKEAQSKNSLNNKISNFAFAAFGNEITAQLKELQFTSFIASELREHNQTSPELWQNQTVSLQVKADNEGRRFWYVSDPSTGEDYKLGVVSPKGAQLPQWTTALGRITADTIATATLNIPGIDRPITFGKMNEHDFANVQFKGESVRVIFKQIGDKPLPILSLDGREIGELDSRSVEMLKNANRLKEGMLLDVCLNTLGKGNGTYTLATTALGNTIRVNRQAFAAYPSTRFSEETAQVTVSFKQSKPAMGVWLEVDGIQKLAGIFTVNHKSSKFALIKAGLWKDGATMNATITSNITVAQITIDSNSIKYPALGEWVTPQLTTHSKEPTALEKNADTFLAALKKPPSFLHRHDLEWTLPDGSIQEFSTLGLTVDASVAISTSKWLTAQKIPHEKVDPNDISVEAETARGYLVFRMKETDVTDNALTLMRHQCGEILEANLVDVATISPYYQKLEQLSLRDGEWCGIGAQTHRRTDPQKIQIDQKMQGRSCSGGNTNGHSDTEKHRRSKSTERCGQTENNGHEENINEQSERRRVPHSKRQSLLTSPEPLPVSQLQAERTLIVAPIVKDYLDLASTHHHNGQIHSATWDAQSNILSLIDRQNSTLLLMAKWENNQWTPLCVPLLDPSSPNLTEDDVKHFSSLVPRLDAGWEKKRALYRSQYESIATAILSTVKRNQPTSSQLDTAIALSVLCETENPNEVSLVLSQSDTVLHWKSSLPPQEYQRLTTQYIENIYTEAVERLSSQQQQLTDREDLER